MSELQIALLIVGLGAIAAVYGYGRWQQREYSRRMGTRNKHKSKPLREDELETSIFQPLSEKLQPLSEKLAQSKFAHQLEHWLEHPLVKEEAESQAADAQVAESMVESTVEPVPSTPAPAVDTCQLFNERSDYVVEIHLKYPGTAALLSALWPCKFDFGKPLQVCGLTENAPHWERVIPESAVFYTQFRIALQMLDRGGVLSTLKMASFMELMRGMERTLSAEFVFPDVQARLEEAHELDKLCVEVDKMVGINLMPLDGRMLFGAQIAQAAAAENMSLEADGAFHLLNIQGQSLFSLINQHNELFQHHTLQDLKTAGVTLLLDAPRASDPLGQFDLMLNLALALSNQLDVSLVDDYRMPLDEAGLDAIRAQLALVETMMFEHGITPGSAYAKRLFD
ncbi:MAG: cell division protein ZipA C-terminal FtsZ-binding domain-containing protein [Gallionella sp.]|nr:cell division protein ZipA C-terminal FtsZ-binding domain-containing protein [Gallionella sp.]